MVQIISGWKICPREVEIPSNADSHPVYAEVWSVSFDGDFDLLIPVQKVGCWSRTLPSNAKF